MGTLDQIKEINLLKNKISELEAKIQNKDNDFTAFGRSYSKVGSSDSDFLIRTKGQVKIQWGSKFIDLIKDGKINVDSKFIYKESQVGVKDGIYIIGDETNYQVILKIGDQKLNLKDSTGNAYISFQEEQHTNAEQKYTALTNIGFLYKSIEEIDTNSLQNGIIYIESDQKLYIVQNGTLSEFTASFPSPYNKQFVIQKSDGNKGSILIVGSGIENSIAFDSFYLYTSDEGVYLESDGSIYFKVAGQERVVIGQEEAIFSNEVSSQMFKSKGATETSGFRLYFKNNQSTLEVDNLIIRNQQDSKNLHQLCPIYWYYKSNLIVSAESADNPDDPSSTGFGLHLAYQNEFEIGQKVYVYLPIKESGTGFYNQILLPLNIEMINTEGDQNTIFVTIIEDLVDIALIGSLNMSDVFNQLQGQEVFLISVGGEVTTLIRRKENNIDLIEVEELPQALENEKIITRVGNIEELKLAGRENDKEVPIEGYGTYSKNAAFLKAQYTKEYELPCEDNSTKFPSTEWIHKLLPKGSIIMFGGASSDIPDGWAICDGQNGTPNLVGKFIKAGSTSGEEGGEEEIKLTSENMPKHTHTFVGGTFQTSVDGEHTHTVSYKSGDLGDLGDNANNRNNIIGDQTTTTSSAGAHSHTIDMSSAQLSQEGQGTPLKWEPKYYSLIYIMKII